MSQLTEADKYLLGQIRAGSERAWSELVDRYQGRLHAFARTKLPTRVDPEDLVQETFMNFLKGLGAFREQAGIETYLFSILRRKIADCYRGRTLSISLIQDVFRTTDDDSSANVSDQIASSEPTASWYARRSEQVDLQRKALAEALRELIDGFKAAHNFRDLQIVEMIFYCQLRNKNVGTTMNLHEKQIALIKHRCLRQIQARIAKDRQAGWSTHLPPGRSDSMLSEIWTTQRLSCLKRSTIGAYLLGTLDQPWHDYVAFHLEQLGCRFCRANLEDLRQRTKRDTASAFRNRIMESTIGFLHKP